MDWRAAAGFTAAVAEAVVQEQATAMALSLPVVGLWSGSGALGRRLGVPRWLSGTAMVAFLSLGAYRLLLDPARRASVKDIGGKVAETFAELLAEQSRLKHAGLAGISSIIFSPSSEQLSVRQAVAVVLARSSKALLAREVRELIVVKFDGASVPSLEQVCGALTDGSEFVCVDRYRWQLGRETPPWPGQYG